MIVKWKIQKLVFLLISGTFLTLVCFSISSAELLFSTDIPVSMGSDSFKEKDIIQYDEPGFSLQFGPVLDEGVNVDAYSFNESWEKFSVDVRTTLGGLNFNCMDVAHYEGNQYYKAFNGFANGIPPGVCIDAVTVLADESIVFSVDVPVSLGGTDYQENDLIYWDGAFFSLYFDGLTNGIPEGVNIDGVRINPAGRLFLSVDVPVQLGGIDVKDTDIVEYDSGYSITFDGGSAGLPVGADLDAISFKTGGGSSECDCEGNFDGDLDVDAEDVSEFLNHFGRSQFFNPCTNQDPCSGDFTCDADVDADDVTMFLEDFGRSQFFNPCSVCTRDPWCEYP
jgi:hypothetical protein